MCRCSSLRTSRHGYLQRGANCHSTTPPTSIACVLVNKSSQLADGLKRLSVGMTSQLPAVIDSVTGMLLSGGRVIFASISIAAMLRSYHP